MRSRTFSATHLAASKWHHASVNQPHPSSPFSAYHPYFLDIRDIFPRCASTFGKTPRLLWMHPHHEKGLTWQASQIELLWDTILRGLPIGSFTSCGSSIPKSHWRNYDDRLLDGEQRCLAIALGMLTQEPNNLAHDPDLMLWIDLDPLIPPHSEREFLIRLSTADQPWGFGKSDDCPPLTPRQMRDALSRIDRDAETPEYMLHRPRPRELSPYDASVPVPLGWLVQENEKAPEAFWEAINERATSSGLIIWERLSTFLNNRSRPARESREKIHAAISALNRYRIICRLLSEPIASDAKILDSHLRRLNRYDAATDFFLKSTASHHHLRTEIRRISKHRMPSERLFAIALATIATRQDPDLFLDPACHDSLRGFLEENPTLLPELEHFVSSDLETRLETIDRLLLYDPLTSPRGILPGHLAMIARDQPLIITFLLTMEWSQEDLADMLVPCNPERDQLIKAITAIAWFHKDLPSALQVCRKYTKKSDIWIIIKECKEEDVIYPISNPEETNDIVERNPSFGRQLLLYAQRDYISRHFPSYDPSRRDHWEGRNLPWSFDSLVDRCETTKCVSPWDIWTRLAHF